MQRFKRIGISVGLVAVWLAGCLTAQAMVSGVPFDIAAGSAQATLKEFAAQAHVQLLFDFKAVKALRTPAVSGQLEPEEALRRLLQGSGLTFRRVNDRTIAVVESQADSSTNAGSSADAYAIQQPQRGTSETSGIAQANPRQAQGDLSADKQQAPPKNVDSIQEVIVTAQKREESLQDVPVPVTALSAQALLDSNELRIQDYFTSVPGLQIAPNATGGSEVLAIRGITTGAGTNPTVGVVIDDVPFSAATYLGGLNVVPDVDPGDLARVELLRGPQGTLYGANSLGGLLKFVTADPSFDAVSGRIGGGISGVQNGDELGYNFRGAINVPLSESWAVRGSAFTREDPGYIENVLSGQDGVNKTEVYGGRLSALWRPSQDFSMKLGAVFQDTKMYGSPDVNVPTDGFPQTAGLGDLQQYYSRGTGRLDDKIQSYSAIIAAKIGIADFASISGLNLSSFSNSYDYSGGGGAPVVYTGFSVTSPTTNTTLTQELRFSLPIGQQIDWLAGAFYTHQSASAPYALVAVDPVTGELLSNLFSGDSRSTYEEYAAYTDLTIHVTNKFDVQLGGRESEIRQTTSAVQGTDVIPELEVKANKFTYLLTPRLKLSDDLMVYARLASGYRPGGPNVSPGVPREYHPDTTNNYELGVKGNFLRKTLSIDASLYYIDWKNLQLLVTDPSGIFQYEANGSRAKSEGIELAIDSKPLTGLTVSGWITWGQAVLTEDFPATTALFGKTGDRLPYSSRFSGTISAQQDFPIARSTTGFVGAKLSYVGSREGEFIPTSQPDVRQELAGYVEIDLRAGAKYDSWTVNLFANNIADRRDVLQGGLGYYLPYIFTYIQPRTVGVNIDKRW